MTPREETGRQTRKKKGKMKIVNSVKSYCLPLLLLCIAALPLSCSGVYDQQGDCEVVYRVKFRYDMNLKWADAFASEVKSVHLYAFDGSGTLVREYTDKGEQLSRADYSMRLDLPSGDYRLVAWCGLDNGVAQESFVAGPTEIGRTTLDELMCRLNRRSGSAQQPESTTRLDFLYHGAINVTLPENADGGEYVYTVPLTKDTNHIRVILQQLSADDVDVNEFTFTIEDDNGLMASDNSLLPDPTITYRPWGMTTGRAGVGKEDTRTIIYVDGAIADFTVARLMADHNERMILTITNQDGDVVVQVPIIDYALLAMDYYEEAYGRKMSAQELLDREDEYVLTFFLDQNKKWIDTSILIHSWRVVLQDVDLN